MEDFENLALIYYFILFFIALFAGFIDSIVGGGGLITLPALIACGIPAHLSLATNKLQSVFGSFTATLTYYKSMNLAFLGWAVFFTALGAFLGVFCVLLINDKYLKLIILVFLALTFLYTALKPNLGKHKGEMKVKNIKIFHLIAGLLLGFYDGFLGPGTGSFWIFACVIFLGLDMKNASINTKSLNFTSNVVSLAFFLYAYKVLWIVGILMGLGQIIGAFLGSKLVLKTNGNFIRILFLIVVFATLLKVGYDYFFK
ncbi:MULTISPECIES: TSUP family transporter [unclassified Campylobacter]|uniref:TSUP family transporter n=1 Tax=unclassified Campylobacter TaxID=2593542 RepID=UPI001237A968|nr:MULTISPECIES: TSUP family transporter [unclassified Campylobacter]KAA6224975.1 TSUP family transporter [Campylobacter sp. LR196d]KAA6225297.1 TSUP family transporter [Campylobacter sp. LR286c]KAA6225584.1 TSUP family transporter [Campylobacter sp. LR185c]KAA8604828.1 hypothetical protein CGP82_00150 [Campylobacter sp. LR185c]